MKEADKLSLLTKGARLRLYKSISIQNVTACKNARKNVNEHNTLKYWRKKAQIKNESYNMYS